MDERGGLRALMRSPPSLSHCGLGRRIESSPEFEAAAASQGKH